ncbi:unnamed protein product [Ophioblennius macclurei]
MSYLNSSHPPAAAVANQSELDSVFTLQVLPPLYLVVFLVGVALNGAAACIFLRVAADSGLVVYLKNMVVADLLMLATYPFRVAAQMGLGGWRLQAALCRYTAVLFYSSMYVGILFMGFISLERYVRIVHPAAVAAASSSWPHLLQSTGFARVLAALTWGLLLLGVLPNAVLTSRPADERTARSCMKLKTALGVQWHRASTLCSVSLFWATLLLLLFCYASVARRLRRTRRRCQAAAAAAACRKSNRSIFGLLAVFLLCFAPYHVCRVPYTLSQMPASGFGGHARFLLFQAKEATLFLAALNVCLDPVIYFLMCPTFRESLLRKLSGGRGRGRGRCGGRGRGSVGEAQSLSNVQEARRRGGEEMREQGGKEVTDPVPEPLQHPGG